MIPLAIAWWKSKGELIKAGLSASAGAIVGAALAFPLGQCSGAANEAVKHRAAIAEADARAQAANSALLEQAALQRAADTAKITEAARGRTDAIDAGPDARTSGPECRLNRQRLLDAGVREADLPKCG